MNFNQITIGGRLTRDPEVRTSGETTIVGLGLAMNNKRRGEDEPMFIDATAFGRTGEVIAEHFAKGDPILVSGRLILDQWEDRQTGEKRSRHKVVINSFSFVGGKSDGGGGSRSGGNARDGGSGYGGRRDAPRPQRETTPPLTEADIPF